MSDERPQQYTGGGIGCTGALFLLFLGLKLAEVGVVKDWSWWWVTAPLWIPFGIFMAVFLIVVLVAAIGTFGAWLMERIVK